MYGLMGDCDAEPVRVGVWIYEDCIWQGNKIVSKTFLARVYDYYWRFYVAANYAVYCVYCACAISSARALVSLNGS